MNNFISPDLMSLENNQLYSYTL